MDQIPERFYSILFLDDKYSLLSSLKSGFSLYSKDYSKSLLIYLKKVLKSKKNPATVKLQTLKLIQALMHSKNPHIISYCGEKFYNRFRIFAEFNKNSKGIRRGSLLFESQTKIQQQAAEEFLILLLQCIQNWAETFPLETNKKFSKYRKLYNYLLSKNVTFPIKGYVCYNNAENEKEVLKKSLSDIRKNSKSLLNLILEGQNPELIKRLGQSLSKFSKLIENEVAKYMELEDHDLIKELNHTLDLLSFSKNSYKSWKIQSRRISILDSSQFTLPPTCLYLKDIDPKPIPIPDNLSDSMEISLASVSIIDSSPTLNHLLTEEDIFDYELKGLTADYCKLKEQLEQTEKTLKNSEKDLKDLANLYEQEKVSRQNAEKKLENLNQFIRNQAAENEEKIIQVLKDFNELKQFNLGLTGTIQELEGKVSILELELEEKNKLVDNFNYNKNTAVEHCKYLEDELEEKNINERKLMQKIKELEMKLNVNEKIDAKEEFEVMDFYSYTPLRMSLVPNCEFFSVEPSISEESPEETLNKEFDFTSCENFINARISTTNLPHMDNLSIFKENIKRLKGILYSSPLINTKSSLKIKNFQGSLKLVFENLTNFELLKFKTKLFSDSGEELVLQIDSEQTETINGNETAVRNIYFSCKGIFKDYPYIKVSFECKGEKNKLNLLLPIGYALFFEKSPIDFVDEWYKIEDFSEAKVKTEISSIRKLAKSICFYKNFEYSYTEEGGIIIGSKTPFGTLLSLLNLQSSILSIQSKCPNKKIESLINQMIISQLSPYPTN